MTEYSFKILYDCQNSYNYNSQIDGREKTYNDIGITVESKKDTYVLINKDGEEIASIKKDDLKKAGTEIITVENTGRVSIFWESRDVNGNVQYLDAEKINLNEYKTIICKSRVDPLSVLPLTKRVVNLVWKADPDTAAVLESIIEKGVAKKAKNPAVLIKLASNDEAIAEIIFSGFVTLLPKTKEIIAKLRKGDPETANALETLIDSALKKKTFKKKLKIAENDELVAGIIRDLLPAEKPPAVVEKKSASFKEAAKNTNSKFLRAPHGVNYKGKNAHAVTIAMPENGLTEEFLKHFINASINEAARRGAVNTIIIYVPYDKEEAQYKEIIGEVTAIVGEMKGTKKTELVIVAPQSDHIKDEKTITFAIVPETLYKMIEKREGWMHYVIAKGEGLTDKIDVTNIASSVPQYFITKIEGVVTEIQEMIGSYDKKNHASIINKIASVAGILGKMENDKDADPYFVDFYRAYQANLREQLATAVKTAKLGGVHVKPTTPDGRVVEHKVKKPVKIRLDPKERESRWQKISERCRIVSESGKIDHLRVSFFPPERAAIARSLWKEALELQNSIDEYVLGCEIQVKEGDDYSNFKKKMDGIIEFARIELEEAERKIRKGIGDTSPNIRTKNLKDDGVPHGFKNGLKVYEDSEMFGKVFSYTNVPPDDPERYRIVFDIMQYVFGSDIDGVVFHIRTARKNFKDLEKQIMNNGVTNKVKIIFIDQDLFDDRTMSNKGTFDIHIFTNKSAKLFNEFSTKEARDWRKTQEEKEREILKAAKEEERLDKAYERSYSIINKNSKGKFEGRGLTITENNKRNTYFVFKCPLNQAAVFAGILKMSKADFVEIIYLQDATVGMNKLPGLLKGMNVKTEVKNFKWMPLNTYYVIVVPNAASMKSTDAVRILTANEYAKLKDFVKSTNEGEAQKSAHNIDVYFLKNIEVDVTALKRAVDSDSELSAKMALITKAFVDAAKEVRIDIGPIYGSDEKLVSLSQLYKEFKALNSRFTDLSKIKNTNQMQAHLNKLDKISNDASDKLKNMFNMKLNAAGFDVAVVTKLNGIAEKAFMFPLLVNKFKNSEFVKSKMGKLVQKNMEDIKNR